MGKIIPSFLVFSLLACQSKQEQTTSRTEYKTPPTNTIADAVMATTEALNKRDSNGYWQSLLWESRNEPDRYAQTLWDSMEGSHIEVKVIRSQEFRHAV